MVSNTRLYGGAIAFASGLYSLWSATTAARMVPSGWLMVVLGVVVIVHGAVLLTAYAERFGGASGPLMIVYAIVMLLTQALLAANVLDDGSPMDGMNGGMGMTDTVSGGMGGATAMGWDVGMVLLALLMLVSGVIMARGDDANGSNRRM